MQRSIAKSLQKKIARIDINIDNQFDRFRGTKLLDRLFYSASEVFDFSIGWHLISIIIVISQPNLWTHSLRLAVVLGIESLLVNQILKRLFMRQRPPISDKLTVHGRRPKTTSFPSGHSSSATVAATLLTVTYPRLATLWILIALIICVSRIFNRMHHLSDVIAGIVVGSIIAWTVILLWPV